MYAEHCCTEQWWLDRIWEFISPIGKVQRIFELFVLKKLWRSAKNNGYRSPGFYPWVSGSAWVLYAFVLSRGGRSRKEETAVTSSIHGDAMVYGGGLASAVEAAASLPLLTVS